MPVTHPRPKLVIFDCDGVLVDSETPGNEVLSANLARYGLEIPVEHCMELFAGGSMQDTQAKVREMGVELPSNWKDEIFQETYARLQQGTDVIPGIPALLDRLKHAELPFCVASNGREAKMKVTLGQNGLWDLFHPNAMFSAFTLGVSKPDPGLFLAAARHFNVAARDCVVIEDSESGVRAAAAAGMRCLGYAPHSDGAQLARHNAEIFSTMDAVPGLIGLH